MKLFFLESTACPEGFIGGNCRYPCRYPTYGHMCQDKCKCQATICDHVLGCPDTTTTDSFSESHTTSSVTLEKNTSMTNYTKNVTNDFTFVDQQNQVSTACSEGFIGGNCRYPCRYPSYGNLCQDLCKCQENICDHVLGCPDTTTTNSFSECHTTSSITLEKNTSMTNYTKNVTNDFTFVDQQNQGTKLPYNNMECISTQPNNQKETGPPSSMRNLLHSVIIFLIVVAFILILIYISTFILPCWLHIIKRRPQLIALDIEREI
ncbi:uncharacterized protein LOC111105595 [Crassostrea virginica]